MEIHQTTKGIFIRQQKYARGVLKKFGMDDCKMTSTPLMHNEKLARMMVQIKSMNNSTKA